jgi:hypothetical protein
MRWRSASRKSWSCTQSSRSCSACSSWAPLAQQQQQDVATGAAACTCQAACSSQAAPAQQVAGVGAAAGLMSGARMLQLLRCWAAAATAQAEASAAATGQRCGQGGVRRTWLLLLLMVRCCCEGHMAYSLSCFHARMHSV